MQQRQRTTIWLALLSVLMLTLAACQPLVLPADAQLAPPAPADDAAGALPDDAPLPPDPSVRMGTLDNGLTYIIKRNTEPQDRADSAQIDYGQAQDTAKIEHLRDQLAAVERAEERLANGTYGLSIESGEPIGDGRLQRIPTAERTAQEQTAFERRGGV